MMRTLTACFVTLGIGFMAQSVSATAYNATDPASTVRGTIPFAFAPTRQATFVRKQKSAPKQSASLDRDGDGVVSEEEARAYYGWLFALLDRDDDGTVTKLEFIKALGPGRVQISLSERSAKVERLGVLFGRLDKNGDEQITDAEFMGACDNHFSTADNDGDGTVTVEEFGSRQPL